jgi:DNA polymerase V
MTGAGILDGDLLVVDRAREPRHGHGHVVVAVIDNQLTVKELDTQGPTPFLRAHLPMPLPVLTRSRAAGRSSPWMGAQ